MSTEILIVESTDKLELPAVLYTPTGKTKKAAIYLHGNGDSGVFYQSKTINALGSELVRRGIAFLALNNRGARYKKKLVVAGSGTPGQEDKVMGGAHYELIEDCAKDIDGAIKLLERKGFRDFYLIGFSTGANKICVYDKLAKQNKVSRYVHAGPGDDSGLFYNEIGEKCFKLSLNYAQAAIRAGNPLKVMPKYTGMHPFSAQSAYDILDPNGPYNTFPYFEATTRRLGKKPLFEEYKKITKPQLVVFGESDEFTYTGGGTRGCLNLLRAATSKESLPESDFVVVPKTDHGFHGQELAMAKMVAEWLAR